MNKRYLGLIVFLMTLSGESSDVNTQNFDSQIDLLVHKTPTCGCCKKWVDHLEDDGLLVKTENHQSLDTIKDNLKIEPKFRSCHTAVSSDGYFFEGHVPSKYVIQFLSGSSQEAIGLSVPGMPLGSPGMEVEGKFTPYDVLIHFKDGTSKVFAKVNQ